MKRGGDSCWILLKVEVFSDIYLPAMVFSTAPIMVQGDHSRCAKPPVDLKKSPAYATPGQAKTELLFWSQWEFLDDVMCHPVCAWDKAEFKREGFCPIHVIRIREHPLRAVVEVRLIVGFAFALELWHRLIHDWPRVAVSWERVRKNLVYVHKWPGTKISD